ncbi:MAG: tetratricopeptide repeat protein [Myxococcota bacterium]
MAAPTQAISRDAAWLFGRTLDLGFGAGFVYLATFPLLLLAPTLFGVDSWPILVVAAISFFISAPHYGATLLRVYEQRADRQRYAFFAVHLTIFLVAAFMFGVYSVTVGSLLLTVYITTSPWHVGGQNYGVALMFLRRRGIDVDPLGKRLLYLSFVFAFVLAFLSTHTSGSNVIYAPGAESGGSHFSVLRLGIPPGFASIAGPAVFLVYLGCVLGALWRFSRQARVADLVPVVSILLSQALWFVVPVLLFFTGDYSGALLPFAAIWISAAHSVQYLWVTTYYAQRADPELGSRTYLLRALLAGAFVTMVPGFLFLPELLGGVSWHAGLGVLLFAVVNLHHFALDGAVWKLRDGQVAKALLRSGPSDAPTERRAPGRGWTAVWVAGALALAVGVYELAERRLSLGAVTYETLAQAGGALDRLRWVGRDSAEDRAALGRAYAQRGNVAAAVAQYERSVFIQPSLAGWIGLGESRAAQEQWPEALAAYAEAQALAGDAPGLWTRIADVHGAWEASSSGSEAAAHRSEAISALEQALGLDPSLAHANRALARAYVRDGRTGDAVALLEAALGAVAPDARGAMRRELRKLTAAREAPGQAS